MTDEWAKLQAVFEEARELSATDRRRFLEREFPDDAGKVQQVEAMLAADAQANLPIDRKLNTLADTLLETQYELPSQVGPYRVVELLGRGGMGIVYRGVRDDLGSSAAIKVLHGTAISPLRSALFDQERQLLASLRHPGIAQLHDSGTLEDGSPFFIMEEIDGLPIDQAVAKLNPDAHQRIRWVLQACSAIQYAHSRGVVHCDIKPTNLLVSNLDREPSVSLLDFGIAQRLKQPLESEASGSVSNPDVDSLAVSAYTPAYAAPEQTLGQPASTLSDQYALGVLLYELLCGRRPATADARANGEASLVPLSEKHRSASSQSIEAEELAPFHTPTFSRFRWRELDAICTRALELNPEARYPTVDAFAADLQRFLTSDPLETLADQPGYRWKASLRRHRVGASFAASILGLLLIGTTLLGLKNREVAQARDLAIQERIAAEGVSDFLVDLFQASNPSSTRGAEVPARALLDQAANRLLEPDAQTPRDRRRFLYAISQAYHYLGLYDEQATLLEVALENTGSSAEASVRSSILQAELAGALLQKGDIDAAEALLVSSLEAARASPDTPSIDVLALQSKQAQLHWLRGELDEAERLFLAVIPGLEQAQGEQTRRYFESLANLGAVYSHQGRYEEAGQLYQRAIDELSLRSGADHPTTLLQRGNLATLEIRRENFDNARRLLLALLEDKRRVLGDQHADTLRSVNGLAVVEHKLKNLAEARELFSEAIDASSITQGPEHRETLALRANLAAVMMDQGEVAAARDEHQKVYEGFRKAFGPDHAITALTLHNLAGANGQAGEFATADRQFKQAQAILDAALPDGHPHQALNLRSWASLLREAGYEARARPLEERAEAIENQRG